MDGNANIYRQKHTVNLHNNADFHSYPRNAGNSCSHFLVKFFVIALCLCVLPLFPSDPPEFISQTIFAKSWELIHLLVIGTALSYGLFCRPKTGHVPPRIQSSQPFASNILHHSSIFNYEEGNPSAFSDDNAIPTKSFDFSCYEQESFVDLRRVNYCKSFDEKPLGLPVRSLRSRVLDSDSEEQQNDCASASASDCESDLSDKCSNVPRSETDLGSFSPTTTTTQYGPTEVRSMESFSPTTTTSPYGPTEVGSWGSFSPILCKSQSMRSDYYMAKKSEVEAKQVKFQSFRSPVREASSCQRAAGFCSWLPESPNMMGRENSLRENNFYMPFSNFTQVNDFNMMGLSPNSQNTSTNFFMPSAAVPSSVPFPVGDLASTYSKYTPSAAAPFPMSVPASDFGSTSGRYNYEAEQWSRSPNLQKDAFREVRPNSFIPAAAAFPPLMPSYANDFAPSVEAPESKKIIPGSSVNTRNENRSENHNGRKEWSKKCNPLEFIDLFPAGKSPGLENKELGGKTHKLSVSSPANDYAASQGVRFKHGPFVQKDEEKLEKNDVDGKKLKSSVLSLVNELAASQGLEFKHGPSVLKDEDKSEKKIVDGKKVEFSVFSSVNEFGASQSAEFKHGPTVEKDEERSETETMGGEKINPSVLSFVNDFAALRGAKHKNGPCIQQDEEKSEEDNLETMRSYGEENNSTPLFVDQLSIPNPKLVISPKKNEQRTSPERWDDDCFVIPLVENTNMGNDLNQGNPILKLSDSSSEAPSSARSSTRMSFHEQNLQQNEVEEHVQWSVPTTHSEIENLVVESESYKPSTPSPPPQIQTRRNNLSADSSSRALGNLSLTNYDNQGSPPTPGRKKALLKRSHSRRFSCGSFFDRDLRKSFKDEAKEANRKTKGDHQFAKGGKCGCLMLDVKPSFNKAALKGKSVRTIRSKEFSNNEQKNNHNEGKHKGDSAGERKGDNPEMVVIKIGISEKRSSSNDRKGEKLRGSSATSILVGLNTKQNSNGTAVVPIVHEVEEENDSEIDKKADEFIAKFKEQIRLQKVSARGESSRHHT